MGLGVFKLDRYHGVMAEFMLNLFRVFRMELDDPATFARFYVTQRKAPFTTFVGHFKLLQALQGYPLEHPRRDFLTRDRANLVRVAELFRRQYQGTVRAVAPGRLIFANQPILDVVGPFAPVQLGEVGILQVVDLFATSAYHATGLKLTYSGAEDAIGEELEALVDLDGKRMGITRPALSEFALRRGIDSYQSLVASVVARICGWDDTSNMEAGFTYGLMTVGTMAHFLMLYAIGLMNLLVKKGKADESFYRPDGTLKHPQLWVFERWLDAHPNGTSLLIDTFGLELGLRHAIEAALSSPQRRKALRFVRVDSLYAPAAALFTRRTLDANGLSDVKVMVTGDLDRELGRRLIALSKLLGGGNIAWLCSGFGIGTKYVAEHPIAGAIFKAAEACSLPVCKASAGKGTFPGHLQVYQITNSLGVITRQVTGLEGHQPTLLPGECGIEPLLVPFYGQGGATLEVPDPEALRRIFWHDLTRLQLPVEQFARNPERVGITRELQQLMGQSALYNQDLSPTAVVFPEADYAATLSEVEALERGLALRS